MPSVLIFYPAWRTHVNVPVDLVEKLLKWHKRGDGSNEGAP
jgi:hypothetical protein